MTDNDEEKLVLSGVSIAVAHSAQVLQDHWEFTLSDRKLFVKLVTEHILESLENYEQKQPTTEQVQSTDIEKEIDEKVKKADRLLEIVEDEDTSKQAFDKALAELAINRKELQKLYYLRKNK